MAPKKWSRADASSSEPVLDQVVMATDRLRTEFGKQQARLHCRPRWYDKETGLKLNIDSTLSRMLGELGASSLLTMRYPGYQALTSEILSSLSMDFEADTIAFQLGNETRSMTLAEFNGIFGFDHHPESCIISDRILERFWFWITGDSEIENSIYPGSSIVNPAFRVAARVFSNTIYARKECSKPLKLEVMCLFLLVHRGALNLGREFLEHVHRYKNMKGEILVWRNDNPFGHLFRGRLVGLHIFGAPDD